MSTFSAVEICAGAGGQALGLMRAGFHHEIAIELDATAAETLRSNTGWKVVVGDVADETVWRPQDYEGIDLLAGGVPCPPFSVAGKQLGSSDERDLFAWAVEQVDIVKPRALLLENVRGLSSSRFTAYRQRILDRLAHFGYIADWKLLQAADFGLAQLRPRFVLVALREDDARFFQWPNGSGERTTVGQALGTLMSSNGWPHVDAWATHANRVGPTLVGGSKKHGGADLGPTRAKTAWAELGVNGKGVADEAPGPDAPPADVIPPKLTIPMVARLQGWDEEANWSFTGGKTSQYRQIGNAFPPPMAEALGRALIRAFMHEGEAHPLPPLLANVHDPVYKALFSAQDYLSADQLSIEAGPNFTVSDVERALKALSQDFELKSKKGAMGTVYLLGEFKGFTGQAEHSRNEYLSKQRSKVS